MRGYLKVTAIFIRKAFLGWHMKQDVVETLISQLKANSDCPFGMNIEPLSEYLARIDVPESSRFGMDLSNSPTVTLENHGENNYHSLKLSKLLRNVNAKNQYLSAWKSLVEATTSKLGITSSDVLSRKIRREKQFVDAMSANIDPYSLLAILESYDYNNPENQLFVMTRPILVIPYCKDHVSGQIMQWQKRNTTYSKEVSTFFPFIYNKKITEEEFPGI